MSDQMNHVKVTKINATACPQAVTHIRNLLSQEVWNNKGFAIFKGLAYMEIEGEIWHIAIYTRTESTFENNWTDESFGFKSETERAADALKLVGVKHINSDMACRFFGWMEQEVRGLFEFGDKPRSLADAFARFVEEHKDKLESLPSREIQTHEYQKG